MSATRVGDLYYLKEEGAKNVTAAVAYDGSPSDLERWHRRMGHVRDILTAKRDGRIEGVNCNSLAHDFSCDVCSKAKMTRTPFPKFSTRESNLLDLVHTDVCGPMRFKSLARSRYFIEFIDDKSRWCEVCREPEGFDCKMLTIQQRQGIFESGIHQLYERAWHCAATDGPQ